MSIRKVVVASAFSLLSAGVLLGATAVAAEGGDSTHAGQCEPKILSVATHFPKSAQERGESGLVRVRVVLDKEGRAIGSKVVSSSGSQTLDRAAEKSVNSAWKFDVSHCIASALPVTQEVNVQYRPVPKVFSASINRRGIAYAKEASANAQCSVVPTNNAGNIISCIERAAATGLATR